MLTELTTDTLETEINQHEKVLVQFSAGWCGNCRIMKPKFKKILEHNNKNFDMTEVIQGEHTIELHKEPFFSVGSSAELKYNASIYNLKENDWE